MEVPTLPGADEQFEEQRSLLFGIAYRMLGSVMDAEDAVQEAYLRWQASDRSEVESPRAYLSTIVTRYCIDQLRSARARREEYVGPWLPEPLVQGEGPDVAEQVELAESLSMAFLVLLERLSPVERAVFLLSEVFGYEYAEIARIVERSEANCRQIAHRARQHVRERRPRFDPGSEEQQQLTAQFLQACASGDLSGLMATLAEGVTLWSDGGGKVAAAPRPIQGADRVARFLLGILAKTPPGGVATGVLVNGEPGLITYMEGRPNAVAVLEIAEGRIQGIRIVVNPDKLQRVPPIRG
jgi:RNA polymerase sigma-70 factor, ECF subfamily